MIGQKYSKGTYLDGRLIQSKAFSDLARQRNGGSAIQILLYFRLKLVYGGVSGKPEMRKKKEPINHRELQFTYKEAESLGFLAGRFNRALDLLVEYGFIDVVDTGMGLHKITTVYGISDRWKAWGTPEFKEVKRPRACQYNVGFQPGNDLWKRGKKETTATSKHGAMFTDEHGGR